jgi:hypothetical protein
MSGDSPKQLTSSYFSSEAQKQRDEARRAYRMQQVEMMEQTAVGLGLQRQDSMKLDECLQQMERLNRQNSGKLSTVPTSHKQRQEQLQRQRPSLRLNRFMGVLRRTNSDESLEDENEDGKEQ